MGSSIPIRDVAGKIVGLRSSDEPDPVQAMLDASLKAVGATPPSETTTTSLSTPNTPPRPSWSLIASGIAVLSIGLLAVVFLTGRETTAPTIVLPSVATIPTPLPTTLPTALPSVVPQTNPHEVTLSTITLYGDYDEATRIGSAPSGIACALAGQSPDGNWAYLTCPPPTNNVWAKVAELGLNAKQQGTLRNARVISRVVPTAPAFSPPSAPLGAGPSLAFCADRSSIWGKTHQCAETQAAADALADGEMGRINATAEAIQRGTK